MKNFHMVNCHTTKACNYTELNIKEGMPPVCEAMDYLKNLTADLNILMSYSPYTFL